VNTGLTGVDWEEAITAAKAAGVPTLAFGSHVDMAAQQAARRAGADRVISNSRLALELPAIVERLVQGGPGRAEGTASGPDDVGADQS
jgi:hypothetical protein